MSAVQGRNDGTWASDAYLLNPREGQHFEMMAVLARTGQSAEGRAMSDPSERDPINQPRIGEVQIGVLQYP